MISLDPFPHFVADFWFDRDLLRRVLEEFPPGHRSEWRRCDNEHERKFGGGPDMWGPATVDYFAELERRADDLADLFGLPDLHMEFTGGGYHLIEPGGFLDVHTDFSRSPATGRYRRLNVLTFLGIGWNEDDGGVLELWDDDGPAVEVLPEFGHTVAFVTSSTSWHGHPTPTKRKRRSLAGYFFTDERPADFHDQSTVWHPNGGRR